MLLVIGSSRPLQAWIAATSSPGELPCAVCATIDEALRRIEDGFEPSRVLLEGNPRDPKLLAAAALLQLCGCKAPLAFLDFAHGQTAAPAIVCVVEQQRDGQRVLACQLQGHGLQATTDAQVLLDYQAPCRKAAGNSA